jgi:hypothetical protein
MMENIKSKNIKWCCFRETESAFVHAHKDKVVSVLIRQYAMKKFKGMDVVLTPLLSVHNQTIPTERPPIVGDVSANFCR